MMGNCQACDRPLSYYDIYRVACKNGHIWTLPEFADMPVPETNLKPAPPKVRMVPGPLTPGKPAPVVLVHDRFPAWLPGAVLGGLALTVSLLEVVL